MCREGGGAMRGVPQQRIREKLDEYMGRRDYAGATRHLDYWLSEARATGDLRGELMLHNEFIGHCRKTGDREGALTHIEAALSLLDRLELRGTLSEGTTCVNAATALNAFGENARALSLFERARTACEGGDADPGLLGGLYNNMALTCVSLKRYADAEKLYAMALAQMAKVPNGQLEQAITCLNLADLTAARDGMEAGEKRIFDLLDRASALLDTPGIPRDGHYAFVCEKCAPTFEYYGYFADARRLRTEAARLYEGH